MTAPLPDAPPPYRTVVFDCDSTLSAMEGIESLAGPEHAAEIAELTNAAMDGTVALEEVFGRRLALLRPTRDDVARVGRRYVELLLPNTRELVRALRFLGKRVVIVSGGLLPAVRRVAQTLGVEEVHAVDLSFDAGGAYAGFDQGSPLTRSGGKIDVLRAIGARLGAAPLALVGDGVTDLEAAPFVQRFVAFGGVVERASVFRAARVHARSADYRELAPLLLSVEELRRLAGTHDHAELVRRQPQA